MSEMEDKINYIKNMIRMMCCDGEIAHREKKFLARAAREIGAQVDDWNLLLKEVLAEGARLYPVSSRDKAIATLKSLIVMAKADKKVDDIEKEYILRFAKSIGVSNSEWGRIKSKIDIGTLFEPFKKEAEATKLKKTAAGITVLKENFDRIDDFTNVANQLAITTKIVGFDEFITGAGGKEDIVCFHAAEDKDESVLRCKELLARSGERTVAVLTRYQGHQVKYMLEEGLKKCIIEPVYTNDIDKLF
ncbi:MAG TPA: hypothetical protein HPP87_12780 [Planctomycetes bacterium]|nr:hypothetical protein [Planctomycetota bacterium]